MATKTAGNGKASTVKGVKKTVKATTKTAAKVEVKSKVTIGSVAIAALTKKADAQAALATVLKAFPKAKTTIACVYWYASQNGIRLQKPAATKAA